MGSAASISSLRDHSAEDVINKCAELYSNDPKYFEYVVTEAKKKAAADSSETKEDDKREGVEGVIKETVEDKSEPSVPVGENKESASYDEPEGRSATIAANGKGNSIDLLSVINRARTAPSEFIPELQKHMDKFIDETVFQLKMEGKTINIRTSEGRAAVADAIEFLKSAPSVEPMKYSPLLEKSALDHVRDIYNNSISGHEGSDGSTMVARVERYAAWSGSIAENIDMGNSSALDIVIALIVDDGVPTRGHRNNLFDSSLNFAGSALGPHPEYDYVCVIDFAGDIKDLKSIFQEDIVISCKGTTMSASFEKVLHSIPMQQVHDDVKKELASGHEVEIEYSFSNKSAEVRFITKSSKRTMKLKWGPSAAA